MISITIPDTPPSLNKTVGRTNVWTYREAKKEWTELVYTIGRGKAPLYPYAKAVVHLTYYFCDNRRRDLDNYIKPVTDGLVKAGIIKDDCWQCVKLDLQGAVDKRNPRVEVTVEEL